MRCTGVSRDLWHFGAHLEGGRAANHDPRIPVYHTDDNNPCYHSGPIQYSTTAQLHRNTRAELRRSHITCDIVRFWTVPSSTQPTPTQKLSRRCRPYSKIETDPGESQEKKCCPPAPAARTFSLGCDSIVLTASTLFAAPCEESPAPPAPPNAPIFPKRKNTERKGPSGI